MKKALHLHILPLLAAGALLLAAGACSSSTDFSVGGKQGPITSDPAATATTTQPPQKETPSTKTTTTRKTTGSRATTRPTTSAGLEYTIEGGRAVITGYKGSAEQVAIPSSIAGYPVREIGDQAFADRQRVRGVTIPGSVTTVGDTVLSYRAVSRYGARTSASISSHKFSL